MNEVLKRVYRERESRQGLGGGQVAHSSYPIKSVPTSGEISPEVVKPSERAAHALGVARRTLNKAATVVSVSGCSGEPPWNT